LAPLFVKEESERIDRERNKKREGREETEKVERETKILMTLTVINA
jgi:hypothetical protein